MLLNLDVKEVDQIMAHLMKAPWAKSNSLIQKIMTQANNQSDLIGQVTADEVKRIKGLKK